MFFKEKVHIHEVIKWGIMTGLIEGLIILGVSLLWFNRNQIIPLPAGWEFAATLILFSLLAISAIIATVLVISHPCYLILKGQTRDGLWTILTALITLGLFMGLIILASHVLV